VLVDVPGDRQRAGSDVEGDGERDFGHSEKIPERPAPAARTPR
jgi:hypothetical protein